MLEPNVAKRATISQIIAQPVVVMRHYENYFDMGDLANQKCEVHNWELLFL